jgi:hypothetical protein
MLQKDIEHKEAMRKSAQAETELRTSPALQNKAEEGVHRLRQRQLNK